MTTKVLLYDTTVKSEKYDIPSNFYVEVYAATYEDGSKTLYCKIDRDEYHSYLSEQDPDSVIVADNIATRSLLELIVRDDEELQPCSGLRPARAYRIELIKALLSLWD